MQHEKIKKIVSWTLCAVCMALIFYFSSRTANQSSEQSGKILELLTSIFGENVFTDFLVRKAAHLLEFTGLSLLFSNAFYQTLKNKKAVPIFAFSATSLYAVSDEIHQIFVDGRSCQFVDWAIDSLGAVLGMVFFYILLFVVSKIKYSNIFNKH